MGLSFHVEMVRNGFIVCSCPATEITALPSDNLTVIEDFDTKKLAEHLKTRFDGKHVEYERERLAEIKAAKK